MLRLPAWLGLEDYEARKKAAVNRVVRRFSRGNVALQQGKYVTSADLKRRSEAAVVAMKNIDKLAGKP